MGTFSKNATPWKAAPKVGSLKPHAGRRAVHSVPDTLNTRCDGCAEFECIPQERSRIHPWRFYCDKLGRELDYKELFTITKKECPLNVDMRERRFK